MKVQQLFRCAKYFGRKGRCLPVILERLKGPVYGGKEKTTRPYHAEEGGGQAEAFFHPTTSDSKI
jgi:hypothetical protein